MTPTSTISSTGTASLSRPRLTARWKRDLRWSAAHGGSKVYTFTPKPTGTRWYHSHDVAGKDLTRSMYAGLYGFLIIEPTNDPGRYDKEVLLAAHHWEGRWVSMQDIRKGPPPDNGLEVMYSAASFNDKMLGHGEPVRVRDGERVLFRLLNASATENIKLALPGHRFTVLTLDGNPVPTATAVDVVALAPAERADVIVEMSRPGVWIMGEIDDDYRKMGLGIVIEYANQRGEPQWSEPPKAQWNYTAFGRQGTVPEPDGVFPRRSRKSWAVGVATTAGRLMASHGRTQTRCSRSNEANATDSS